MWGIWRLGGCLEVFVAFIRSFLSRFCGISCLAGSVGEYIYGNICIYSTGYKMLNHNVYSHVDSCLHLVFTCLCPVPKCIDLYWYVYYRVSCLI